MLVHKIGLFLHLWVWVRLLGQILELVKDHCPDLRHEVREGIKNWIEQNPGVLESMPGGKELIKLIERDDDFVKALIRGSPNKSKPLGLPTKEGMTAYLNALVEQVNKNGGSFEPLLAAYHDPGKERKEVLAALRSGKVEQVAPYCGAPAQCEAVKVASYTSPPSVAAPSFSA